MDHGQHASEEAMEQYAMGRLPALEVARFEEHLLVCPLCQERLREMDEYLGALRTALVRPAQKPGGAVRRPCSRRRRGGRGR